jgi:hypothetical protein
VQLPAEFPGGKPAVLAAMSFTHKNTKRLIIRERQHRVPLPVVGHDTKLEGK